MVFSLVRPTDAPWLDPSSYWPSLTAATSELDPPYGVISLQALAANAFSMLDRANGTRIRVASKSVRVRAVIDAVLALPGFGGILAYTLDEALWLAEDHPDVVVGYPSVDRAALRRLALSPELASGNEAFVSNLTVRRVPGVSHWVQQDAPEAVNASIAEWVRGQGLA